MTETKELISPILITRGSCDLIARHPHKKLNLLNVRADFAQAQDPAASATLLENGVQPMSQGYFFWRDCAPSCGACFGARANLVDYQPTKEYEKIIKKNAHFTVTYHQGFDELLTGKQMDNEYTLVGDAFLNTRFPLPQGARKKRRALRVIGGFKRFPGFKGDYLKLSDETGKVRGFILNLNANDVSHAPIYFYDPALLKQSIGQFLLFKLMEHQRDAGFRYLYLGDWTNEPGPYSYKDKIPGLELHVDNQWIPHTRADIRARRANPQHAYPPSRFKIDN